MTNIMPSAVDKTITENTLITPASDATTHVPLREQVKEFVRNYFRQFDGAITADLYAQVLAEVELPLLEAILRFTGQNQSTAARLLKISRGTLRKKMFTYGLLNSKRKNR